MAGLDVATAFLTFDQILARGNPHVGEWMNIDPAHVDPGTNAAFVEKLSGYLRALQLKIMRIAMGHGLSVADVLAHVNEKRKLLQPAKKPRKTAAGRKRKGDAAPVDPDLDSGHDSGDGAAPQKGKDAGKGKRKAKDTGKDTGKDGGKGKDNDAALATEATMPPAKAQKKRPACPSLDKYKDDAICYLEGKLMSGEEGHSTRNAKKHFPPQQHVLNNVRVRVIPVDFYRKQADNHRITAVHAPGPTAPRNNSSAQAKVPVYQLPSLYVHLSQIEPDKLQRLLAKCKFSGYYLPAKSANTAVFVNARRKLSSNEMTEFIVEGSYTSVSGYESKERALFVDKVHLSKAGTIVPPDDSTSWSLENVGDTWEAQLVADLNALRAEMTAHFGRTPSADEANAYCAMRVAEVDKKDDDAAQNKLTELPLDVNVMNFPELVQRCKKVENVENVETVETF